MTVNTAYNPFNQPVDLNGAVLSGAKWYFYENGTTTLKDVYQDQAKTSTHANPVIADANGRFPDIWLEGVYSIRIAQSDDTWITGTQMDDYNKGFSDVDAAATAGSTLTDFEYDAANSSGLNFKVNDGTVDNLDGTSTTVTTAALSLSPNTTNYVYLRLRDNTVVDSTAAGGANTVPLYEVITDVSTAVTVTDKRASRVARRVFPANYLYGLDCTINSTDASHDIDIAIGGARDINDLADLPLASAFTKQIDATWVETTNSGGMATDGVSTLLAADTDYNIFLIGKTDGSIDVGFDTSATAGNLLTNDATTYTYYRKIGTFRTDASSDLFSVNSLHQDEDKFDARVRLARASFSGVTSFTLDLPKGYRYFELFMENVRGSTSDQSIIARLGNDGSIDSGASDYNYASATGSGVNANNIPIGGAAANNEASVNGAGGLHHVTIFNPHDENAYTQLIASGYGYRAGSTAGTALIGGSRVEVAAHDQLQILTNGGVNFEGSYTLYGVK